MATNNCQAYSLLSAQIARQKKYAWDIDKDIAWSRGVDGNLPLLPLDENCIVFPGLNAGQRRVVSQLAGLMVNATIAEMESAIDRVRDLAWREFLRRYPVNPEMEELGVLFFDEELKHSKLFTRYLVQFCNSLDLDPEDINRLLPKLFGSRFVDAIMCNARAGGHAFWWIVAIVEETSIRIYQEIAAYKDSIDPLFFEIHKRHMEEETRHCNYAFLVLDLIANQPRTPSTLFHRKTDLIYAQTVSNAWLLSELQKVWKAKEMGTRHNFFSTLCSVLPHFRNQSLISLPHYLLSRAPYVSLFLNVRNHPQTLEAIHRMGAARLPMPTPRLAETRPA